MLGAKIAVWVGLGVVLAAGASYFAQSNVEQNTQQQVKAQLSDDDAATREARLGHWTRNQGYAGAIGLWAVLGVLLFAADAIRGLKKGAAALVLLALLPMFAGCGRKPFEPITLETIGTSEEGFLIPYTGDGKKQASSNNEEYLKQNLVYTKQIRIPQQWIQKGYETYGWDGEWQPAAKLIKVDKSPVTREWTADQNSGTSNKNEAIWVMTSDQVEFSTGWTCTARIESRDDAVKFLHNYPAGTLKDVMDTELRAKLQAIFGLEVTDLPMDELRKKATPHILTTVKAVTAFFKERGITITNLGITGGFVYKDKSILDTMVKVFNAEQEKATAAAALAAQDVKNKTVLSEAEGKAAALLKTKKAEADGIKMMADAQAYEITQASQDLRTYLELKRIGIDTKRWEKWDGRFPTTLLGSGAADPNLLMPLSLPTPAAAPATTTTPPPKRATDKSATDSASSPN